MTLREFKESTASETPPDLIPALFALWLEAKGDWKGAHEQVQLDPTPSGAWVHGYLHRKEGDVSNAHYWYRRADKPAAGGDLSEEWAAIAKELLAESSSR